MAAYFFASPIDVDIRLEGEDARRQVEVRLANDSSKPDALTKTMRCPVYYDGEGVAGQVAVRVRDGKVTTLRLANNIGQDREVSARAHGFRRMIEKVGDKVRDSRWPSFRVVKTCTAPRHGLSNQWQGRRTNSRSLGA